MIFGKCFDALPVWSFFARFKPAVGFSNKLSIPTLSGAASLLTFSWNFAHALVLSLTGMLFDAEIHSAIEMSPRFGTDFVFAYGFWITSAVKVLNAPRCQNIPAGKIPQEGRKIWNDILDLCRDIALTTAMFRKEARHPRFQHF